MFMGVFDKLLRVIAHLAGGLTLLLGLVVIFGWYTGNETLVQVLPEFVPMQYNTALGFVFCGAGLLLRIFGKNKPPDLVSFLTSASGRAAGFAFHH